MNMEGLDEVYKFHRFQPTDLEAVTYFLPRLLAGETLNGAEKLIYHADVYAFEPKGLTERYAPVPTAVSTGDRFFFTTCKRNKNGRCARVVGAGTWTINKTADVCRAGVKVGEVKHLSFKKGKASTGWVMEEYRCLLPEALVADGEMVLSRIHLKQNPPATAREESDAYKNPVPQPAEIVTVTNNKKRPAPVAAAADLSSCKRTRIAAPVPAPDEEEYEDCPVWFTPAAPISMPAASTEGPHVVQMRPAPVAANVPAPEEEYEDCPVWYTEVPGEPEADDDNGRFSCTMEELLGEQQDEQTLPVEAENNTDQLVFDQDIDLDLLDIDLESMDLQSLLADVYEEEAGPEKSCNYYNAAAADLQAPSLQGQNQFFSCAAVS